MKYEFCEEEFLLNELVSLLKATNHLIMYDYKEYGKDFIRFKKEGGKLFEIKVRELKPRKVKS